MSSRRRITVALVGLLALVVIGWLVREFAGFEPPAKPHGAAVERAGVGPRALAVGPRVPVELRKVDERSGR